MEEVKAVKRELPSSDEEEEEIVLKKRAKTSSSTDLVNNEANKKFLRESLTCAVCLEIYKRPILSLPACGHNICWECLYTMRTHQRVPKCPSCQSDASNPTIDHSLQHMEEYYRRAYPDERPRSPSVAPDFVQQAAQPIPRPNPGVGVWNIHPFNPAAFLNPMMQPRPVPPPRPEVPVLPNVWMPRPPQAAAAPQARPPAQLVEMRRRDLNRRHHEVILELMRRRQEQRRQPVPEPLPRDQLNEQERIRPFPRLPFGPADNPFEPIHQLARRPELGEQPNIPARPAPRVWDVAPQPNALVDPRREPDNVMRFWGTGNPRVPRPAVVAAAPLPRPRIEQRLHGGQHRRRGLANQHGDDRMPQEEPERPYPEPNLRPYPEPNLDDWAMALWADIPPFPRVRRLPLPRPRIAAPQPADHVGFEDRMDDYDPRGEEQVLRREPEMARMEMEIADRLNQGFVHLPEEPQEQADFVEEAVGERPEEPPVPRPQEVIPVPAQRPARREIVLRLLAEIQAPPPPQF